jgi:hypothetical protein
LGANRQARQGRGNAGPPQRHIERQATIEAGGKYAGKRIASAGRVDRIDR